MRYISRKKSNKNLITCIYSKGFPCNSAGKEYVCKAGDPSLISGPGRSSGEEIGYLLQYSWAHLVAQMVKNPPARQEPWLNPWVGKIPWRRAWQPTSVFLLENPQGQRTLVGYFESLNNFDHFESFRFLICLFKFTDPQKILLRPYVCWVTQI